MRSKSTLPSPPVHRTTRPCLFVHPRCGLACSAGAAALVAISPINFLLLMYCAPPKCLPSLLSTLARHISFAHHTALDACRCFQGKLPPQPGSRRWFAIMLFMLCQALPTPCLDCPHLAAPVDRCFLDASAPTTRSNCPTLAFCPPPLRRVAAAMPLMHCCKLHFLLFPFGASFRLAERP